MAPMYPDGVRNVHLEITNKCNASCPMCARNQFGGAVNPNLTPSELSLEDVKAIFPPEFIASLERMYMCGNYGDPMSARDTLEVFEYFKSVNPGMALCMHTNASGRTPEWWNNLGKLFYGGNRTVRFSVDGLEDTNHLYRVGTRWDKIISAMENYIAGGGAAIWEFLVFKHNQHQIEEAEELARKLGFKEFQVKKTGRFSSSSDITWENSYPVYNRRGEYQYFIQPTDIEDMRNRRLRADVEVERPKLFPETMKFRTDDVPLPGFDKNADYGLTGERAKNACIDCKAKRDKEIFVDAHGHIFPCCWTGYPMYDLGPHKEKLQIANMVKDVGPENINAISNVIWDLLDSPWMNDVFTENWTPGQTVADGKIMMCSEMCGEHSHVTGEYENESSKF